MKNRNRKKIFILALGAIALFGLTACDSENDATDAVSSETTVAEDTQNEQEGSDAAGVGFTFEANNVVMNVDMDMAEVLDDLGEPMSTFEEPSCAAQGTAYIYTYAGYQITTYPDGDINRIGYITLKDDTVATPEGIDLSCTKNDVIKAYGDDATESDTQLSYEKDGMTLNFIFDGDSLASIEYTSSIMK